MASTAVLHDALNIQDLNICFQPVTDLGSLEVVGVEALMRPVSQSGEMLSPGVVFTDARRTGLLADLDEEARYTAIETFSKGEDHEEVLLFLNYAAETWNEHPANFKDLASAARRVGIRSDHVAIEFVESELPDHDALETLAAACREAGFLISLDDFGTQHSNLERVVAIKPDVIRIDRSVVGAAHRDRDKCTLLRSITHLAQTMGALSLAEGIETYEDLYTCSKESVHLAQGFLLGRPSSNLETVMERGAQAAGKHRDTLRDDLGTRLKESQLLDDSRDYEIAAIVDHFAAISDVNLEAALRAEIASVNGAESAYIVGLDGIQVTPFVTAEGSPPRLPVLMSGKGRNLSLRDFIYGPLFLGQRRFVSKASLSVCTGQPSYTIATRFTTADKTELILCIDLPLGGT